MVETRSRFSLPLLLGVGLIAAACLYLSFELGRYQAGYSLFDERERIDALVEAIGERDSQIEALERQIAILETSGDIDAETYSAVEAQLSDLQGQIQGLEEQLAFYQGIVAPGDGASGLRIQNVEIASSGAGVHTLQLLLVQSIVHNERVTGSVRLRISGTRDDTAVTVGLDELAPAGEASAIPYGFRYFQSIEQDLALPEGLVPEQLEVEIQPDRPRGDAVTQVFQWAQIQGN